MTIYLVSYDLNKPDQDYQELFDAIKIFDNYHLLKSAWLVSTTSTAEQVYNVLSAHTGKSDYLLVSGLSNYHGYLLQDAWNWIKSK